MFGDPRGKYKIQNSEYYLTSAEELKAELATREHIPNKQEAKKLRQQKAKMQKSR